LWNLSQKSASVIILITIDNTTILPQFTLPIHTQLKIFLFSSPHLFYFYPSEVSEVNKINVLGIGHVSEKVTLVSENMLYVSEILGKMTYILELFQIGTIFRYIRGRIRYFSDTSPTLLRHFVLDTFLPHFSLNS
jgi:hypothetical protein